MKYPFVPFPERKPLRWPNGKRLALMITTNLEYWDQTKDTPKPFYPGGPGIVGGDLPGQHVRQSELDLARVWATRRRLADV